jgi:nucleoid-associated protein YgaU
MTTPRAAKPNVRYEVQAGDSLSRVAARHYGSRSKSVIDAVFDANRATMSSPDALKVGQVILLPEIEGVSRQSSSPPAQADAGRSAPPASPAPPTEYRPYQVRKGDRYITIAKEQLGDGSRWREIAELNRDVFPDPAKIRYGVRIRLPVDSKSRQTGQRS